MPLNIATVFPLLLILASGLPKGRTVVIDPDEEWLEIPSGADCTLKCTGDEELHWEYPKSHRDPPKTSTKTVNKYRLSDGRYGADLLIKKAHYMDTGVYNCSSGNYSDEQQLYLYVRDAVHLLAIADSEEHIMISHPQYQDLIIPCRPTSHDVNVTLLKDDEPVEVVHFESQRGFILHDPTMNDSGYYRCHALRRDLTKSVIFHISILPKSETVSKPIISVEGYEGKHIIVGQDITIGCNVTELPGAHITLDWEIPIHVKLAKVTYSDMYTEKIEIRGIEKRRSYRNLEIKSVSIQDKGTYVCRVSDHSGNTNEEHYQLEVYSVDMKFLNLSMEGKSEIQVRVTEREAQWIVNIEAYPTPDIKWFGPNNEPLPRNDKYTILIDSDKTKITVHNISIEDSGIYTLKAINAVKKEMFNVTLLVEDKPKVYLQSYYKNYYDINKEVDIECNVTAYPLPVINWTFTECTDYKPFCAQKNRMAPISMEPSNLENIGYVKWLSRVQWYARDSGIITCKADNYLGVSEAHIHFKITDVDNGFDIWGPKRHVLSSDSIVIGCGASIYEYEPQFEWIYKRVNGSEPEIITNSSRKGVSITTNKTSFSYQTFLSLNDVNVENSGTFSCRVYSFVTRKYKEKDFKLLVTGRMSPIFLNSTTLNGSVFNLDLGRPINFTCSVIALPEPEILWYKDNNILDTKGERIRIENKNQTLLILYTKYEDAGRYTCNASNGPGNPISAFSTLKLKGPARPSRVWEWASYIFVGLIIVVVVLVIALISSCHKAKRPMDPGSVIDILKGQVDLLDPNVDIGEQADLLPYDKKWEFPKDKLKLGKQLGSGAFGIVMKGEAMGIFEDNISTIVAVKMVKQTSDITHIKALLTELKIMAHLGQHLNVVNLLGACTGNVHKHELFVLVEYCKYGNLHKYLMHHRNTFINQIDPTTGTADFPNKKEPTELTYLNANNYSSSNGTTECSNGQSVHTDMTSLSTPIGDDGYLLNKDLIADYQGDYKINSIRPICTQDLFCWAFQVAKGMEYLASRKVLHGDLAARNVLLAEGNVVKISDFGLAKSLYSKENYKNKKRDVLLPVKWMSIEAIRDGIFSTQSDLWSFGILLWEMFSLAITPYPGLYGEQFYNKLLQGYRMQKPKYATEDVYNMMLECWKEQPMLRPSFTECAERLGSMLGETVREHYLELNSPYMQKNTNITSENDHLSKLKEPSYENCLQSGIPEGCVDGYVCMKAPKNEALNEMELRPMITPGCNSFLNPAYQDTKNFKEHKYSNMPLHSTNVEVQPDSEPDVVDV